MTMSIYPNSTEKEVNAFTNLDVPFATFVEPKILV